jgi:hypothetical protein
MGRASRISDILSDAGSQEDEDEDAEFTYPGVAGDYSTQLEELFDGEEDSESGEADRDPTMMTKISYTTASMQIHRLAIGTSCVKFLVRKTADERKRGESTTHSVMRMGLASHEDDEPLVCVRSLHEPQFPNYCHLTATFECDIPRNIPRCLLVEGVVARFSRILTRSETLPFKAFKTFSTPYSFTITFIHSAVLKGRLKRRISDLSVASFWCGIPCNIWCLNFQTVINIKPTF